MKQICLIVEFYADGHLVFAEQHTNATELDGFVYTENFKVKVSDTTVIPEEKIRSINKCEHRVIVVDDAIGTSDSRFIAI
ncbi:MAG: hypothetical protein E7314_05320 [Clostridiales bacterium]|nr:hypothetical protein [Clostridiales bacterium]